MLNEIELKSKLEEIYFLNNESTNWGGREEAETANPEQKIDEIFTEYWDFEQKSGSNPLAFMQLVNGCIELGLESPYGVPDKNDSDWVENIQIMIESFENDQYEWDIFQALVAKYDDEIISMF